MKAVTKRKIAIVIGTRPEAIKLIPIYFQCLKSVVYEPILISTGQHLELLQQVFEYFSISPHFELEVMKPENGLSKLTAELFKTLDPVIEEINPDLMVVQGDTSSAWVAALVGFYQRLVIVHVEAGLRTGNKFIPFPEELYRKQISHVAAVHFTPTALATNNLTREGFTNVYQVGNTIVDNLRYCLKQIQANQDEYAQKIEPFKSKSSKIVLVTCHRRENISKIEEIAAAIKQLAERYIDISFVLPLHMNPMVRKGFAETLNTSKNVFLIDPVPYDEFVFLLSKCYLVLTDSGGVQEEAASCQVPLVVLRELTERDEAVVAGCALMAGTTTNSIVNAFEAIHKDINKYAEMQEAISPFGDGKSSNRILKILEQDSFIHWLSTVQKSRSTVRKKDIDNPVGAQKVF